MNDDKQQPDKPDSGEEELGEQKSSEEKPDAPQGGAPGPEQMTEEELRAELEKHFREQSVSDLLVQFLVTLSNLAYMKMGLTEETKDAKDLEQASLAIDSFKAVLDSAGKRLPGQDASALAGALSSMQLTFARESAAETGGGAAGGSSPDDKDDDNQGESSPVETGEKPEGDGPASRIWVPGKE